MTPPRRIGILGHVGRQNLGDEAIIEAFLDGARAVAPGATFTAFTMKPSDTTERHGIAAFQLRPRMARLPGPRWLPWRLRAAGGWIREAAADLLFWSRRLRHVRSLDLLAVTGSNQLSDYFGGPWGFPYTIWAWTTAARMCGVPVVFLSVGAGPIRSPWTRRFIRSSLAKAAYVSVRDVGSKAALERIGIPGPHRLAPDLAQGHRLPAKDTAGPSPARAGGRMVVINPLPYFDPRSWAEPDADVYARYIDQLAAFAVAAEGLGDIVRFVPTQLRVDPPVVADLLAAMERRSGRRPGPETAPAIQSFEDVVALFRAADVVVATRFHGVLIAQMCGAPTVGIVYRPSTRDLMEDCGQGAFAIDIRDISAERLLDLADGVVRERPAAAARIEQRFREYREALMAQYRQVLDPG